MPSVCPTHTIPILAGNPVYRAKIGRGLVSMGVAWPTHPRPNPQHEPRIGQGRQAIEEGFILDVLKNYTPSRLNRAHPGKDTTYILDFVNSSEEVLQAFRQYYETAEIEAATDPNLIFDLRAKLDAAAGIGSPARSGPEQYQGPVCGFTDAGERNLECDHGCAGGARDDE